MLWGPRWETPVADSDSRRPTDIRRPDQRLRVFASSTLGELNTERGAAREAIEQLRLAPVMFESGARPHPAQEVYRAYLEQSDVFVGARWSHGILRARSGRHRAGDDAGGLPPRQTLADEGT